MNSKLRIRRYEEADQPQLVSFLEATLAELGFEFDLCGKDADIASIGVSYPAGTGAFLVLERDAHIVGCVGIRQFSPTVAELKRLYLLRGLRGSGLGRELSLAALGIARDLGYEYLRLDTTHRSPEAIKLFKKLGFEEIPAYNSDPYAELFMELRLSC